MSPRYITMIVLGLLAASCAKSTYVDYTPGMTASADHASLEGSLFPGDQAVMSNETIAEILSAKVGVPTKARLAVLQLHQPWGRDWWSREVAQVEQAALEGFLTRVRSSPNIGYAAILPSLLTPRVQSVPYLREAAARYQADLLLLYRSTGQSYTRSKFLGGDEVRAYCMVEAVLLDTRTGIIPFSSVVSKDYTAKKTGDDLNFGESVRKAHVQAFREAIQQIADELVTFLDAPANIG